MQGEDLSRRQLIEAALRMAAAPAGMVFFGQWSRAGQAHQHASGTGAPPQPDGLAGYQAQFFGADDFAALEAMTEILIPTDETPGAREAYCAHFLDFLLRAMDGHSPETQAQWRAAMSALRAAGFHQAGEQERQALVAAMARPETDPTVQHPAYAAYRLIKRETAFSYYTARAGMIENLDYRGNSYNVTFPACSHPEHHDV